MLMEILHEEDVWIVYHSVTRISMNIDSLSAIVSL